MASPTVTNTSAQLDGASLVYGFTTTLTDAQIKTLPTTPVQVVAAPGTNLRIKILSASFYFHTSAGTYTNIDTSYAALTLTNSDKTDFYLVNAIVNDSSLATPLTQLTATLGVAANVIYDAAPTGYGVDSGAATGVPEYVTSFNVAPVAGISNLGVYACIDNSASGNITGGNAANSLRITVYYAVEALA